MKILEISSIWDFLVLDRIKCLRVMKLTILISLICLCQAFATATYSQTTRLTFDVQNVKLKEVLTKIESESEFFFVYSSKLVNVEILSSALSGSDVTYSIIDKQIILSPKAMMTDYVASVSQQQRTVTGKVIDTTGGSLPGVSVVVKGTTNGTVTDAQGIYSLGNVPFDAVLVFSFVGMKVQEVALGNRSSVNITLEEETIGIEEVVAIGYGTQKKSDLTGAIARVSAKDMEKANPTNFADAIQGRATGVVVVQSQGAPGSSSVIRVRGIGTVNNNDPLYVIDGMFTESMNDLNPADIESMEVLKDASAQAIYGSRAANGVILITTKRGSEGKSEFNFNASYGVSNPLKLIRLLDNEQFYDYSIGAITNGYMRQNPTQDPATLDIFKVSAQASMIRSFYNLGYNTNWMDEIMHKNAPEQKYDFSYAGGTAKAKYSLSGGYFDQNGIIQNSNYKRYTVRINTEFSPNKIVSFGENIGMSYGSTKAVSSLTGSDIQGPLGAALAADPLTPPINPDANPYDPNYQYNKYMYDEVAGVSNPVAQVNRVDNQSKSYTMTGNAFVQAKFLKGFTFKSSFGIDFNVSNNNVFTAVYYLGKGEHEDVGGLNAIYSNRAKWLWENTLNYNKTIGKHVLTALIGYTSEQRVTTNINANKTGVTSNDPLFRVLSGISSSTSVATTTGTKLDQTMASVLARVNYVYGDKYLFTASVRNDGTSKFDHGYKYGTFPSFSGGWRVINENFMSKLKSGFMSDLKFRAGWGTIGNQSILQDYGYLSLITISDAYKYNFGSNPTVASGSTLSSVGTSDIKWETTAQTNFGVDLGFLKNSLTLSVDYFDKKTDNMLLTVTLPSYVGFTSNPVKNIGGVSNKGFEISAIYKNKVGAFNYNLSANFTKFTNEVTNLQGGIITGSDAKGVVINRTQEGSSIGRFWGYQTNGIFQNAAEVQAYTSSNGTIIQPLAKPGDVKFKDLNGDGVINASDQTWIGSPLPVFTYGFNIDLQYKSFTLNAFFQGSQGNKIYDLNKAVGLNGGGNIPAYLYESAWHGDGTSNSTPIYTNVDTNNNFRVSDLMVQDASYLRLKSLQLGYDLPQKICTKINVKKVRIWVGGANLLTFSKYKGVDPEDGLTNSLPTAAGLVYTSYPKPQTLSVGLNTTF